MADSSSGTPASPKPLVNKPSDNRGSATSFQGAPTNVSVGSAANPSFGQYATPGTPMGGSPSKSKESAPSRDAIKDDFGMALGAARKFKDSFARRGGGDAVDHCFYKLSVSQHRRLGYKELFWFLVFLMLYFAMLFLQRQSAVGFEVYTSLSGVVPDGDTLQGTAEIEAWLSAQVSSVWVDPECGDGVCVDPWEFPEYGRFGCRADCGRLVEVRNVTELQFDFYTNFTHPGIPSTELLSQASWNICPRSRAPHGSDCYFLEFQGFPETVGFSQVLLGDIPDGDWQVVIRGDDFEKISGAIRSRNDLQLAAVMRKVELAASMARAMRVVVQQQLLDAATLAHQDNRAVAQTYWRESYEQLLESLRIANNTGRLSPEEAQLNVAAARSDLERLNSDLQFAEGFAGCIGIRNLLLNTNLTSMYSPQQWTVENNPMTATVTANGTEEQQRCAAASETVWAALLQRNQRVRDTIATRQQTASDILDETDEEAIPQALRNSSFVQQFRELRMATQKQQPELWAVIMESNGLDSLNPITASLQVLATSYANTQNMSLAEMQLLAVTTRYSLADLAALANARAQEMNNWSLPVSPTPSPLPEYNIATFNGGGDAYLTCDLENRGSQYDGVCSNTLCPGPGCIEEEVKMHCESLCICHDGVDRLSCGTDETCVCSVCEVQRDDIAEISRIQQIDQLLKPLESSSELDADVVIMKGEAVETARPLPEDEMAAYAEAVSRMEQSMDKGKQGRRLQQASQIDAAIRNAQDAQSVVARLEVQVSTLTTYVEETARASIDNDRLLQNLISSGQVQLTARQDQILSTLQTVIDRRNAAQELAQRTFERLDQLTALSEQQAQSLQEVQQVAEMQLQSIQDAQMRGALHLDQALELLGRVRLQQEINERTALLANTICSERQRNVRFSVQNYKSVPSTRPRDRDIGLSNKLLAGMLLHSTRQDRTVCENEPFFGPETSCFGGRSTAPFGIDPVFKRGAGLYQPGLDTMQDKQIFYNCSALPSAPTFNVETNISTATYISNDPPYCAELYNVNDVPYGFKTLPLEGYKDGFPVFFDINLSEQRAQDYLAYVIQGLYLDSATEAMTSEWVTYNSELRVYAHIQVEFGFSPAGLIDVSHSIGTLRTDVMSTSSDYWRLVLEIVVFVAIFVQLACNVLWAVSRLRAGVRWARLLTHGWLYFDLITILLMIINAINWWSFTFSDTVNFSIEERYDVYADLDSSANFLELANNGADLQELAARMNNLKTLLNRYTQYFAIAGVVIILNVVRMLKAMDFQPRLGIVTRSLLYAGSDLGHFFVMSGSVFLSYVLMGHLLFGQYIDSFSSVPNSLTTCFALVLGEIDVNGDLQTLPGIMQSIGALYFWTYMILVFLVLLNFLLAIIVDAFSEVKSRTGDTIGVPAEITRIAVDKARTAMRLCGKQYVNDQEARDVLKAVYKARKAADEDAEQKPGLLDEHEAKEQEKTIPIGNKHISSMALANLLYTILDPVGDDEEVGSGKPAASVTVTKQGLCGKSEVTPDLDEVADALLDRFGEYKDEVGLNETEAIISAGAPPVHPGFVESGSDEDLQRRLDDISTDRTRLQRQVAALLAASPAAQEELQKQANVPMEKRQAGPGPSRLASTSSAEAAPTEPANMPSINEDDAEQIHVSLLGSKTSK